MKFFIKTGICLLPHIQEANFHGSDVWMISSLTVCEYLEKEISHTARDHVPLCSRLQIL